jgi:hypothetical protein
VAEAGAKRERNDFRQLHGVLAIRSFDANDSTRGA